MRAAVLIAILFMAGCTRTKDVIVRDPFPVKYPVVVVDTAYFDQLRMYVDIDESRHSYLRLDSTGVYFETPDSLTAHQKALVVAEELAWLRGFLDELLAWFEAQLGR